MVFFHDAVPARLNPTLFGSIQTLFHSNSLPPRCESRRHCVKLPSRHFLLRHICHRQRGRDGAGHDHDCGPLRPALVINFLTSGKMSGLHTPTSLDQSCSTSMWRGINNHIAWNPAKVVRRKVPGSLSSESSVLPSWHRCCGDTAPWHREGLLLRTWK